MPKRALPRPLPLAAFAIMTVAVLLTITNTSASSPKQGALEEQLDGYLTRVAKERGLNAAVLVAQGDDVILRKGYGISDDVSRTPFTADTAVGIASVSKQFTAAAILRLVDQGRLSVSDTLGRLLPGVPADKQGITLHQLLTHTSGVQSDHMKSDLEPLTRQEALTRIFAASLDAKPGEKYLYSNSGYTLLAAIVEQVSGQDHDAFLRKQFFDPLGMNATGNWADARFKTLPVSTGYMNGEPSGPVNTIAGPYWTVIGNGGIVSTVDDMFTWYGALHGGRVLSAESTQAMFTSYKTSDGSDAHYGYGWEMSDQAGLGRLITHNGGGLTGNSIISHYVDKHLLILILGNRITYQMLGPVPFVIDLPADETSRAIANNVASGDFTQLPAVTFAIWPYLVLVLLAGAVALSAGIYVIKRRRK